MVYTHQWDLGIKVFALETAKKAYYITLPNKAQAVIPAVICLVVQQTRSKRKDHKCFHMRNALTTKGRNHAGSIRYHSSHRVSLRTIM